MMSTTMNGTISVALDGLAERLTGELVRPGEGAYDEARSVWNGMIDLRPVAVARCGSAADVAAVLGVARETGLPLAVRGGGHNVAGFATVEDGIVIDLSPLNGVAVDPEARRVRVGGGATLGDLDAATQEHGLVVPLGVASETGVAGLTLSGGLGWVRRKWGLSCDNLVGAEIVTADGAVLRVDADTDPELLWGLRGGGGNFGVVTEFEFEAHPLGPEVFFAFTMYPLGVARDVLAGHERVVFELGDDVSTIAVLGHVPPIDDFPVEIHGEPYVAVLGLFAGSAEDGERALQPLCALGEPLADLSGSMPFVDVQQIYDADYPAGHRYYWKSAKLPSLSPEVIDALAEQLHRAPSKHSTIDVWLNGGAIARVAEDATAFSGRDGLYVLGLESNWEDPADDQVNIAWARGVLEAVDGHASGGAYLNFPGFLEEGQSLVRASMGDNYARLAKLKGRLDPENLFRRNANVEPAA
jgi:FAD/FMN-containing dehydrogenase